MCLAPTETHMKIHTGPLAPQSWLFEEMEEHRLRWECLEKSVRSSTSTRSRRKIYEWKKKVYVRDISLFLRFTISYFLLLSQKITKMARGRNFPTSKKIETSAYHLPKSVHSKKDRQWKLSQRKDLNFWGWPKQSWI